MIKQTDQCVGVRCHVDSVIKEVNFPPPCDVIRSVMKMWCAREQASWDAQREAASCVSAPPVWHA